MRTPYGPDQQVSVACACRWRRGWGWWSSGSAGVRTDWGQGWEGRDLGVIPQRGFFHLCICHRCCFLPHATCQFDLEIRACSYPHSSDAKFHKQTLNWLKITIINLIKNKSHRESPRSAVQSESVQCQFQEHQILGFRVVLGPKQT